MDIQSMYALKAIPWALRRYATIKWSNILNIKNIWYLNAENIPLFAPNIYIILHLFYKHRVRVLKPDPFIRVDVELELRDS